MIKKILICLLPIFLFFGKTNAQEVSDSTAKRPTLYLTFTPSAFLHPRLSGVMGGIEYRFHEHLSFVQDISYTYQHIFRERRHKGIRSQSEIRWYIDDYDPKFNFFFGAQFRYWKVNFSDTNTFCRAGCQYEEVLTYDVKQTGKGGNLLMGVNAELGGRFYFEAGGGIGIIQRTNNPDIPEDATILFQDFFFGRNEGEQFTQPEPVLLGWIKLTFVLF